MFEQRLEALKNALSSSTEGIKEILINSNPAGVGGDDQITYSHRVLVKVIPDFSEAKKTMVWDCFQNQIRQFPVGEVELNLEIDDRAINFSPQD